MLIQKDVKRKGRIESPQSCLRALLIQKDVKRSSLQYHDIYRLRALLIQKDVKHFPVLLLSCRV